MTGEGLIIAAATKNWKAAWVAVSQSAKMIHLKSLISKIQIAAKTTKAFKSINNLDDVIDIANTNQLSITHWNAILISWSKKTAEVVLNKLKAKGWIKKKLLENIIMYKNINRMM